LLLGSTAIGLSEENEGSLVEKELYAVDAKSTATYKMWLSGKGTMEKEKLWNHIAKILTGIEGKRTYVLATSMDNIPLSTTIEFYLDPEKKILYGFAEKGTEKLIHIKNNSKVSLNWHEEFMNDFSKTLCVQIRGFADLFEGDCPEINEALKHYRYQYMLWNFIPTRNAPTALAIEPLQKAMKQLIKKNIMLVRVNMEQVVITDTRLEAEGYRPRQLWRRR
jgi:general stress protein 26